jgi:hypothetical protein
VTYIVQTTSSLTGTWAAVQTFPSGGTAPGTVTVQDSQLESASTVRFMRLKITHP